MSPLSKVIGALTRQGMDHPVDVGMQIYVTAWIITAFVGFVVLLGVMMGAAQ